MFQEKELFSLIENDEIPQTSVLMQPKLNLLAFLDHFLTCTVKPYRN